MAKKKTDDKPVWKDHCCEDCANAEWYYKHINLDYQGKPICCKCKYHEFSKIRSETCRHWQKKSK